MEMVPAALAICAVAGEDTKQAIIGAANLGRDADTIAGIAGELAGALYGVDVLPEAWVKKVLELNPNPDLRQMAADLTELVIKRNQDQLDRSRDIISGSKV
jgi:ADP-ribosylglycohydrolase